MLTCLPIDTLGCTLGRLVGPCHANRGWIEFLKYRKKYWNIFIELKSLLITNFNDMHNLVRLNMQLYKYTSNLYETYIWFIYLYIKYMVGSGLGCVEVQPQPDPAWGWVRIFFSLSLSQPNPGLMSALGRQIRIEPNPSCNLTASQPTWKKYLSWNLTASTLTYTSGTNRTNPKTFTSNSFNPSLLASAYKCNVGIFKSLPRSIKKKTCTLGQPLLVYSVRLEQNQTYTSYLNVKHDKEVLLRNTFAQYPFNHINDIKLLNSFQGLKIWFWCWSTLPSFAFHSFDFFAGCNRSFKLLDRKKKKNNDTRKNKKKLK